MSAKRVIAFPQPQVITNPVIVDKFPTSPLTKGNISLLQYKIFEKLKNSNRFYLTSLTKEASADHIAFLNSVLSDLTAQDHLVEMAYLLKEFVDIIPVELLNEPPPLRDKQHAVDLVFSSQLPSLSHYRSNTAEHAELNKQVQELLSKVFF